VSWTLRAEPEPVYNIEVDGDHCYRVGRQGLLVHNASDRCPATENECMGISKKPSITNGNGTFSFVFDGCRTLQAEGPIATPPKASDRKPSAQTKMLNFFFGNGAGEHDLRRGHYDAGHLIRDTLGGPGDWENLVPQDVDLNRSGGDWFELEKWIVNCLQKTGCKGYMKVVAHYPEKNTPSPFRNVPHSFDVMVTFCTASTSKPPFSRKWQIINEHGGLHNINRGCP
jgi:hypothetical protein